MRSAGAPVGGRLPSSSLRGAKKRLIATLPNSKFELTNWNYRDLPFSNRNSTRSFSRSSLPLQNPNRQLETIRNRHNPFTINQMAFSNRPKKTGGAAGTEKSGKGKSKRDPSSAEKWPLSG
jgi:hypothetical protein